jgi:hypothetical protein
LGTGGITFVEGSTELSKAQGKAIGCYGREGDQKAVYKLGCGKEALVDWEVSFQDVGARLDNVRKEKCAQQESGSEANKKVPTRAEAAKAAASLFGNDDSADSLFYEDKEDQKTIVQTYPRTGSRSRESESVVEVEEEFESTSPFDADDPVGKLYAKKPKNPTPAKERDDTPELEYPAKDGDDNEVLILVAQEFLDALPIEQFELTEEGWCETLVDINPNRGSNVGQSQDVFRFVRGKDTMPFAPPIGPPANHRSRPHAPPTPKLELGLKIETGGAAIAVVQQVAKTLEVNRGAALFVDYGGNPGVYGNSLRGIRGHKFVPVLSVSGVGWLCMSFGVTPSFAARFRF